MLVEEYLHLRKLLGPQSTNLPDGKYLVWWQSFVACYYAFKKFYTSPHPYQLGITQSQSIISFFLVHRDQLYQRLRNVTFSLPLTSIAVSVLLIKKIGSWEQNTNFRSRCSRCYRWHQSSWVGRSPYQEGSQLSFQLTLQTLCCCCC